LLLLLQNSWGEPVPETKTNTLNPSHTIRAILLLRHPGGPEQQSLKMLTAVNCHRFSSLSKPRLTTSAVNYPGALVRKLSIIAGWTTDKKLNLAVLSILCNM